MNIDDSLAEAHTYLAFMECLGLDFPLLLQTVHDVLVTPADFVRQTLLQLDEHTESQVIAEQKVP